MKKIEESSRISQMILQVGLGVKAVEQVAVEVAEKEKPGLLYRQGNPTISD